jgi:hypothetical protein
VSAGRGPRYLLDENLSTAIAVAARRRGFDVVSSHEVGLDGKSDEEQLLAAANDGRILVTENCKDFTPISRRFAEAGLPHAGVLCVAPGGAASNVGWMLGAIERHARANPAGMVAYLLDYLR